MKQAKPILALILFTLTSLLAAQSLTITAPNGGETLTIGQNTQIAWTAANVSQKIKLQLLRTDGTLVGLIASDRDAASGWYSWKTGNFAGGTAGAGQYLIRVSTLDNSLQDAINSPFTLQAAVPAPPAGLNVDGASGGNTPQKMPQQVTAQVVPYAVITSFKVDGKDNMGGAKVECRRWQGVVCTASTFSKSQPVLYRFSLHLEDTSENLSHLVQMTGWIQQSSYTFNVSQNAVLAAVFGSNPPSGVPLSLFGGITVEAKNTTQTETPKKKSIQIKMLL